MPDDFTDRDDADTADWMRRQVEAHERACVRSTLLSQLHDIGYSSQVVIGHE